MSGVQRVAKTSDAFAIGQNCPWPFSMSDIEPRPPLRDQYEKQTCWKRGGAMIFRAAGHHWAKLRRGAASPRLAATDGKKQGRDASQLAARRRRNHCRFGLRRGSQEDI